MVANVLLEILQKLIQVGLVSCHVCSYIFLLFYFWSRVIFVDGSIVQQEHFVNLEQKVGIQIIVFVHCQ
jgi:hypothetical protein